MFNKETEVGVYIGPGTPNNSKLSMKSDRAQQIKNLLKHASGKPSK